MSVFSERIILSIKAILPKRIFILIQPIYHFTLALLGAIIYSFPSRDLYIVGVTGTKGKSTTVEIVNAILERTGAKTALASTIRFKIGDKSEENLFKMTMPGRFFLQKFLRDAVKDGCSYAIIEMTSEGIKQFRHKYIDLDALIVTNIQKEHIEAHGSYENYVAAKISLAQALVDSPKEHKVLIVNGDDKESHRFLEKNVDTKISYRLSDVRPVSVRQVSSVITLDNEKIIIPIPGKFNIYNVIAAITFAKYQKIGTLVIRSAIEKLPGIRGRMERVAVHDSSGDPFLDFDVIVDYAHTPDSLEEIYKAIGVRKKKICVLGGTGGGRDKWKRPLMGGLAAYNCEKIILTNEDPYDEDPKTIINEIKFGADSVNRERAKDGKAPIPIKVIINRMSAIDEAIHQAQKGDTIIITGKGTDPFIMGPRGSKIPWDDAEAARVLLTDYIKKNNKT